MGISNRDYMRDESSGSAWTGGSYRTDGPRSMVTTLIIINVVVFFAQIFTRTRVDGYFVSSLVERWLALDPADVLHGQIWRLFTYDFLHDTSGPYHLLFNMLILYMAGKRVEMKYGSREFLALYLTAGLISGIVFLIWGFATHTPNGAIGASGAVTAIMLIYALNWPQDRWYFMLIFPMPVILIVMIAMAFDIFPMIAQLSGNPPQDGIAHAAHMGGWAFGYFYYQSQFRISDWLSGLGLGSITKAFKRRPNLKVHRPDEPEPVRREPIPPAVEARLDQLLAKIADRGESSLTDEEREFLAETSRRYRNR